MNSPPPSARDRIHEPCECPVAGFCARFNKRMSKQHHAVCQGKAGTPEQRQKYLTGFYNIGHGHVKCVKTTLPEAFRKAHEERAAATEGAGTELKKIIAWWGFEPTEKCKCNARMREMNYRGADWCEENIGTIVEWLREEAVERQLPFFEFVACRWVRRAIRKARRRPVSGNSSDRPAEDG